MDSVAYSSCLARPGLARLVAVTLLYSSYTLRDLSFSTTITALEAEDTNTQARHNLQIHASLQYVGCTV